MYILDYCNLLIYVVHLYFSILDVIFNRYLGINSNK